MFSQDRGRKQVCTDEGGTRGAKKGNYECFYPLKDSGGGDVRETLQGKIELEKKAESHTWGRASGEPKTVVRLGRKSGGDRTYTKDILKKRGRKLD